MNFCIVSGAHWKCEKIWEDRKKGVAHPNKSECVFFDGFGCTKESDKGVVKCRAVYVTEEIMGPNGEVMLPKAMKQPMQRGRRKLK
jgi:hypothetical protein